MKILALNVLILISSHLFAEVQHDNPLDRISGSKRPEAELKTSKSTKVENSESIKDNRAEAITCYKGTEPTVPPPTGPQWEIYLKSADGKTYTVTAIRNNRELYGPNSRALVLTAKGYLPNGTLLLQSSRGTVELRADFRRSKGRFLTQFYGYDVSGLTCAGYEGIPESAPAEQ